MEAALPRNEAERLEALHRYRLLDTLPEQVFDDLTFLAAQICETPMALVTLVDADRQWFKSKIGLSIAETSRNIAFCAHAILKPGPLVVSDASTDVRFSDNPLVTSDPNIRFYAGSPLITDDGQALGTLCVLDRTPRELSEGQLEALQALSRQVMLAIEARRQTSRLSEINEDLRHEIIERRRIEEALRLKDRAITAVTGGVLITDARQPDEPLIYANNGFERLTGYSFDEVRGRNVRFLQGPDTDPATIATVKAAIAGQTSCSLEILNYRKDGSTFWNAMSISPIQDFAGEVTHFVGVQLDITARKQAEEALQESITRYEHVIEHADDIIYNADAQGRFIFFNQAAMRLLKYSAQELASFHYLDLIRPDYRPAAEKLYGRQFSRKLPNTYFEFPAVAKDGSEIWLGQSVRLITHDGKITRFQAVARDITQQNFHDALTNLPNRALFEDRMAKALERADAKLALILIAPDNFNKFSETLGYSIADRLLRGIAERLSRAMPEGLTLARFGPHEFSLLLPRADSHEGTIEMGRRILETLKTPFHINGQELYLTASIGSSQYPEDGKEAPTLLQNASAALFRAREQGGDNIQFYTAEINTKARKQLTLEASLRRALEREEFLVYYQPKLDLRSDRITGMEALVRWRHPQIGLVSPDDFIPLAEDTGLIVQLDQWVLRTACTQTQEWQQQGAPPLRVSCNLSARQFQQPDLVEVIARVITETGLAPEHLDLELTESSVMKDAEATIKTLHALNVTGVRLSIDDFGTGYSSLNYLKRFPVHFLKIDQAFVRDATKEPNDAAIVMAIITLAHSLNLKVVAEGVETEEHSRFLRLLRCDEIQGYLVSKPLPAQEFQEKFLDLKTY